MRKCDNASVGEKLTRYESSVRGCIVIMEQPIAGAPQLRLFSPNVLPQTANIAVELGVRVLAFGDKFMVHNPSNVEIHDSSKHLTWAHIDLCTQQLSPMYHLEEGNIESSRNRYFLKK